MSLPVNQIKEPFMGIYQHQVLIQAIKMDEKSNKATVLYTKAQHTVS